MQIHQPKLKQRSSYPSSKLSKLLEDAHKGFAYQILQLQMTIDNPQLCIGPSKLQDITHLVQLYMLGVEVLQSSKNKNYQFEFFRKKLQELMKRKIVCQQLKIENQEYKINVENTKEIARVKRITHLQQIQKKTETHLNQIVSMAQQNIESYKGIVEGDIKKQQSRIHKRIASRERSKERGQSIEKNITETKRVGWEKSKGENVENQYYVGTVANKSGKLFSKDNIVEVRQKSGKSQHNRERDRGGDKDRERENRFDMSKGKDITSYRI